MLILRPPFLTHIEREREKYDSLDYLQRETVVGNMYIFIDVCIEIISLDDDKKTIMLKYTV